MRDINFIKDFNKVVRQLSCRFQLICVYIICLGIEKIHIEPFLQLGKQYPILDVRSPAEYIHAQIPLAYSLPLFSDEERKIVGTAYKQQSREEAIKIGLVFFGPKMRRLVEEVESLFDARNADEDRPVNGQEGVNRQSKTVLVHCWRGGMRSAAIAWLLDLYGFKVYTLIGGYKFFRRWVLKQFESNYPLSILGGFTGSGKTEVLNQLSSLGEQVIDLESLANHKGSAFGNIGLPQQPSQEKFENLLAIKLWDVQKNNPRSVTEGARTFNSSNIWVEDESQRIGTVNIPKAFWQQMRNSAVYFMDIPFAERLKHIHEEYGNLNKEKIISAIERIQKRLGGLETKTTIALLNEGNAEEAFRILLNYYDKWYLKGLQNRQDAAKLCVNIKLPQVNAAVNARHLISAAESASNNKKLADEHSY